MDGRAELPAGSGPDRGGLSPRRPRCAGPPEVRRDDHGDARSAQGGLRLRADRRREPRRAHRPRVRRGRAARRAHVVGRPRGPRCSPRARRRHGDRHGKPGRRRRRHGGRRPGVGVHRGRRRRRDPDCAVDAKRARRRRAHSLHVRLDGAAQGRSDPAPERDGVHRVGSRALRDAAGGSRVWPLAVPLRSLHVRHLRLRSGGRAPLPRRVPARARTGPARLLHQGCAVDAVVLRSFRDDAPREVRRDPARLPAGRPADHLVRRGARPPRRCATG